MFQLRVLLLEDDAETREMLGAWLGKHRCRVTACESLDAARTAIEEQPPDLALIDLELPDGNGLEVIELLGEHSESEAVVISGRSTVDSAISALRLGASDYLVKPIDLQRLEIVLDQARRAAHLRKEVRRLRGQLKSLGHLGSLIGGSEKMQAVYDAIERVAPTDETVLITGQTGTGKEVTARTIHEFSKRSGAPFVAVNCSAVSPALLESEFFGHERGAFTGAEKRRHGLFEQAQGGTLLLDEVTEMSVDLQAKLLRVLEQRRLTRVGGTEEIAVDVRILAASNRDPHQAVRDGKFREDLLYRLLVFPIDLPPLCQREGDIPRLAEGFLASLNSEYEQNKRWSSDALLAMDGYDWPGNVRELSNAIRRAFIMSSGEEVTAEHLPIQPQSRLKPAKAPSGAGMLQFRVGEPISAVEQRLIEATLDSTNGNKKLTAETLGISLKTLYTRLKVYESARGGTHAAR